MMVLAGRLFEDWKYVGCPEELNWPPEEKREGLWLRGVVLWLKARAIGVLRAGYAIREVREVRDVRIRPEAMEATRRFGEAMMWR